MSVGILILVAVVLIGVVIFQFARVNELSAVLRGEGEGEVAESTTKLLGIFFVGFLVLGLAGTYLGYAVYKPKFLPSAASEHGGQLDFMFNITAVFTGIVFLATQVLLFWFAFKYKSGKDNTGYYFPHSNKLEIIWTTVPAIVLTVLVIFGLRAWLKTTGPAPQDAMEVEALAEQFKWNIRYSGPDNKLGKRNFEKITNENPWGIDWSDPNSHDDFIADEIHLPVNKPVLFRLGAKDVLHSFYLPHFRVKLDCVPGIPTQFWFTPIQTSADKKVEVKNPEFTYVLACAELCGQAHWNMRKDVVVETDEEFKGWFGKQKPLYDSVKSSLEAKPAAETQQTAQVQETTTLDNKEQTTEANSVAGH